MSTPRMNGGGRRHSEGSSDHLGKQPRAAVLQFYGRLAAALAAGGVFAVLAYESPSTADRKSKKSNQAADRQGVVTEDDALPHLEERSAWIETEDAVGLARTKTDDSSGMTDDGRQDRPGSGRGRSVTRADQDEELRRRTTAAPHSRGPPGE